MTDQSRRNFLKSIGKVGLGAGALAITGLPRLGEPGGIPPASSGTGHPVVGSPNYYQILHELSSEMEQRYKCDCSIYKSTNEPYALVIYLNGHTKYLGPAYNSGDLYPEARHYFERQFEQLALRARGQDKLWIGKTTQNGNWHLITAQYPKVHTALCNRKILPETAKEAMNMPREFCPRCIILAEQVGIAHRDIINFRNSL